MAEERPLTTHEVRTSYARRFPDADHVERAERFDRWLDEVRAEAFHRGKNEGIRMSEEARRG